MKFLHVAFGFEGKPIEVTTVQKAFAGSGWARYAPNCWIVHTNETPEALARRLHSLCTSNESLLVCELNIENDYGWLEKEIWEWINGEKLRS